MDIKDRVKDYIDLKLDAAKLGLTENLSVVFNYFLSIFVLIFLALIALVFIAEGVNNWLGEVIGSQTASSLYIGGFFALVFIILFALRKRLFVNRFVKLFASIFFDKNSKNE